MKASLFSFGHTYLVIIRCTRHSSNNLGSDCNQSINQSCFHAECQFVDVQADFTADESTLTNYFRRFSLLLKYKIILCCYERKLERLGGIL